MFSNTNKNNFPIQLLDYKKIVSSDLWLIRNTKKKEKNSLKKLKSFIKIFKRVSYSCLFTSPSILFSNNNKFNIFFIRKYLRKDLENHSHYFENLEGTTTCIISKRKKEFNIYRFLKIIYLIFLGRKLWLKVFRDENISFFSYDGLTIFLKLFDSISDAVKVYPILLKHSKLVSFQEMVPEENILCQLANLRNIETFALEHAIGIYKNEGQVWERWPITIFLNSVCKNILCWGNFSKKNFEKHTKAKVAVIGKAGLPKLEKSNEGVLFIFQNKMNQLVNEKLLKISNELSHSNIPVSRWFKPDNILIKDSKMRNGPPRKIVIGSHSIFLFELAYLGFEVYVIKESNFSDFLPKNLIINNTEDIKQKLKKNISENYSNSAWKHFIECSGKESVNRYKQLVLTNI